MTTSNSLALDPSLQKALDSFDSFLPYQLVKIMVSPEMAGRLTGDEGYTKAAKWAASQFEQWGLRPLDSWQSYLQPYPSPYTIIDKAEMSLNLASPGPAGKIEFKEINSSSAELRKALETHKRPISFPLKSKLTYAVSSRHYPNGVGYNVVGWVEGADPKLKKELIVVGANFGHCGQHLGLLFPEANDNASGSPAVMAISHKEIQK